MGSGMRRCADGDWETGVEGGAGVEYVVVDASNWGGRRGSRDT